MRLLCLVLAVAFVSSVAGVAPAAAADGSAALPAPDSNGVAQGLSGPSALGAVGPPDAPPADEPADDTAAPTEDPDANKVGSSAVLVEIQPAPDEAGPPSQRGIVPRWMAGNPDCGDLPCCATRASVKLEPGGGIDDDPHTREMMNGTFGVPGGSITVSGLATPGGPSYFFGWTSSVPVYAVIVKGGNGASVFQYPAGSLGDARLHAPFKADGTPRAISHIEFCYGPADVPNPTFGSVSGFKIADLDGDGEKDPNERGVGNWRINLFKMVDRAWVLVDTTLTSPGGPTAPPLGYYEFTGLPPGTYMVLEVQRDGWVQTCGPTRQVPMPFTIMPLVAGTGDPTGGLPDPNVFRRCFCNTPTHTKYFELTVDDWRTMPAGVTYWVTFLVGPPGPDEVRHRIPLEMSAGAFRGMIDLPHGTLIRDVKFWAMWGDVPILIGDGADREVLNQDLVNRCRYVERIVGHKFHDVNEDGRWQDDVEPGLPRWEIKLYRQTQRGWMLYDTTFTGPEGGYRFTGLLPGTYYVVETQQDGWFQTAGPTGPDGAFTLWPASCGSASPIVTRCLVKIDFGNAQTDYTKTWILRLTSLGEPLDDVIYFVEFKHNGQPGRLQLLPVDMGPGFNYAARMGVHWGDTITDITYYALWNGEKIALDTLPDETLEGDKRNLLVYDPDIFGYKWEDADGDGARDDGEAGLAGWTVVLFRMVDGQRVFYDSTVTDDQGMYWFNSVLPGRYVVAEQWQDGWVQTYPSDPAYHGVFVSNQIDGKPLGPYDFGNAPEYVKHWDLHFPNGITPAEGYFVSYKLNGRPNRILLDPWAISAIVPGGLPDEASGASGEMTVTAGDDITDVEWWAIWNGMPIKLGDGASHEEVSGELFNEFEYDARIEGDKWEDIDGDGIWDDDEPGLGDWTIVLFQWIDGQRYFYDSTVTDDNGHYEFNAVLPGRYIIAEEQRDGWNQTFPVDPHYHGEFVTNRGVEGQPYGPFQFGNRQPIKSFQLTVEGGNPGIPGVEYFVEFKVDGDWWSPIPLAPQPVIGPDGLHDGEVTVPAGAELTEITWYAMYLGEMIPLAVVPGPELIEDDALNEFVYDGRLFGDKFEDIVEDSVWGDDEPGLEGWVIELYRWMMTEQFDPTPPTGGDIITVQPTMGSWVLYATTVTDGDGAYAFDPVLPGTYFVREVLQPGWGQTAGPGAYGSDPSTSVVEIGDGSDEGPIDFGNRRPVKTFHLAFEGDLPDVDGFFVEYAVSSPDNGVSDDVQTASAMAVLTLDLDPVSVDPPDGLLHFEGSDQRWAGETIGQVDWYVVFGGENILLGTTDGELLAESDVTNEFEYGAQVDGHKWDDTDFDPLGDGTGDGVWTVATEPALEDWTIELYRQTEGGWSLYADQLTDQDGLYTFTGLLPGTYYLAEVLVDGWIQSAGPASEGDGQFVIENGSAEGPVDFGNYVPFAPFTEPEPEDEELPFLPFTGATALLIFGAAVLAALAGLALRRRHTVDVDA